MGFFQDLASNISHSPAQSHEMSRSTPSMDSLEMIAAELANSQTEVAKLKNALRDKEIAYKNLEIDCHFHKRKETQLTEIIEMKGTDQCIQQLKVKAMQNAELTVQVEELRRHLNVAFQDKEKIEEDLRLSHATIEKLGEHRQAHKKMLFEMGAVLHTLGQINIGYKTYENRASKSNQPMTSNSLENIKLKIMAIEDDRQRLMKENQRLENEVEARGHEIDTLHRKSLRIEAIDQDRERLQTENKALREQCSFQAARIQGLERLRLGPINENEDGEVVEEARNSTIPQHVMAKLSQTQKRRSPDNTDENSAFEVVESNEDGCVKVIAMSSSQLSSLTGDSDDDEEEEEDSVDDADFSSIESPEPASTKDVRRANVDLVVLKDQYKKLQEESLAFKQKVAKLEKALDEANKRASCSQKKQELRENLLRDVIFQYKQLQNDHEEVNARLRDYEAKYSNCEEDAISASDVTEQAGNKKGNMEDPENPSKDAKSTGPSSETSVETQETNPIEEDEKSQDGISVKSTSSSKSEMVSMEEYNLLQGECARLEHEYDVAIDRITSLEQELQIAKDEVVKNVEGQKASEKGLLEAVKEYEELSADHQSLQECKKRLEEELELSQNERSEALAKQKERERDLWAVIEQYKQLSEENDLTRAKMQGVESELGETQAKMKGVKQALELARRECKRRDLIYEYRRLEKDFEEAQDKIKTLERQLTLSKKNAIRSKEDAKTIRKRLAGCNFHYKQLQQHYDEALTSRAEAMKEVAKAQKHISLYKKQEESWNEKVHHVREQRQQTVQENKKLKEEVKGLKAYVDDLLVLASRSVIGMDC